MSGNNGKSNGKTHDVPARWTPGFLAELDQRTALARELRQRLNALMVDLGGADHLSYQQRALCERAVWQEYYLQQQETLLAEGKAEEFDAGRWTQSCNALLGILRTLGLERRQKKISPADIMGEYTNV